MILADVPEDSLAVTEETFGPTLVINTVSNMDEAVDLANATGYGLGAAVWSRKMESESHRYSNVEWFRLILLSHLLQLGPVPFGGVKGKWLWKNSWSRRFA